VGVISWNIDELSKALKINIEEVQNYFTDGRKISFLLERRLAREIFKGKVSNSENESFDIFDSSGNKWEVRCISKNGVYFCPSYMVGSGRRFDEQGFLNKLNEIKGYVLADIQCFPNIPFWIIPSEQIICWWEAGSLGKKSMISRKKASNLIENYIRNL